MNEYLNECHCGAEIRSPADGDSHQVRCRSCGLLVCVDEAGDVLRYIEDDETRARGRLPL